MTIPGARRLRAVLATLLIVSLLPSAPLAAAEPTSCEAISLEISALLARQREAEVSFWSDPRHRAAAIGATSFTPVLVYPALVYLTVKSAPRLTGPDVGDHLRAELGRLRQLSAGRRCFAEPAYSY